MKAVAKRVPHHSVAAFFDASDGPKVRLSCVRDRIGGPFSSADVARLDQVDPCTSRRRCACVMQYPNRSASAWNELPEAPDPDLVDSSEHHRVQRSLPRSGWRRNSPSATSAGASRSPAQSRKSVCRARSRGHRGCSPPAAHAREQRNVGPPLALVAAAVPCRTRSQSAPEDGRESGALARSTSCSATARAHCPEPLRELFRLHARRNAACASDRQPVTRRNRPCSVAPHFRPCAGIWSGFFRKQASPGNGSWPRCSSPSRTLHRKKSSRPGISADKRACRSAGSGRSPLPGTKLTSRRVPPGSSNSTE